MYVYNWGEYIDPEVIEMFQEETGIEVIYDEIESNEIAYAKLLRILDICLDKLIDDMTGGETGAPCPTLSGLDITSVDVIPEFSIFGGWSGYYMEVVLE